MSIEVRHLTHVYSKGTLGECKALDDVSLTIKDGSFTCLVGRTGCGKSTLAQHLNGLLIPDEGEIQVGEYLLSSKRNKSTKKLTELRKKVGIVFQFPEYQLFEETVLKDVAFGPSNFGLKKDEAIKLAKECLSIVNIPEEYYEKSPFELSGGEKRRVAIAGLLASSPDVLILDEPTAGLDPKSSKELLELFKSLNESGKTIILVTHDMNIVFEYASEVVVMKNGQIAKQCPPNELFLSDEEEYSLETPLIAKFIQKLNDKGMKLNLSN
ncbi:MAG: energy-coupling factor transporter ATPase, partial [Bacilli bacterium]|nr:energy-coupling factor transporter ATPase [Bacilli bacterium]